jgi:hypothetical protein
MLSQLFIVSLVVRGASAQYACTTSYYKLKSNQSLTCDDYLGCRENDCCEMDTSKCYPGIMCSANMSVSLGASGNDTAACCTVAKVACSTTSITCETWQTKETAKLVDPAYPSQCCTPNMDKCAYYVCPVGQEVPQSSKGTTGNSASTCCQDMPSCSTLSCGPYTFTDASGTSITVPDVYIPDTSKSNENYSSDATSNSKMSACCKFNPKYCVAYSSMGNFTCGEGTYLDAFAEGSAKSACCKQSTTCAANAPAPTPAAVAAATPAAAGSGTASGTASGSGSGTNGANGTSPTPSAGSGTASFASPRTPAPPLTLRLAVGTFAIAVARWN